MPHSTNSIKKEYEALAVKTHIAEMLVNDYSTANKTAEVRKKANIRKIGEIFELIWC